MNRIAFKISLVLCALAVGLLSVNPASAQSAMTMSGGTEQAIAAMEQKWLEAQNANKPDAIAPMLADKFVNTDNTGKVTGKAEALADAKNVKWTSGAISDVKVSVFGDTAIATGVFKGKGTDSSGKPLDDNDRWTDTWVKMAGGKWQCVASHQSPIKM
jgi:ketosteroid isomerase-like protein